MLRLLINIRIHQAQWLIDIEPQGPYSYVLVKWIQNFTHALGMSV